MTRSEIKVRSTTMLADKCSDTLLQPFTVKFMINIVFNKYNDFFMIIESIQPSLLEPFERIRQYMRSTSFIVVKIA